MKSFPLVTAALMACGLFSSSTSAGDWPAWGGVDLGRNMYSPTKGLPDAFDAAWARAMLVLSAEADKATQVTAHKDGGITLLSKCAMGEAEDTLAINAKSGSQFHVDPALVVRAAKSCGALALYPRVMALASDDMSFVHVIAHCAV